MKSFKKLLCKFWKCLKGFLIKWSSRKINIFLWENKPFGSYYVSYGLTVSLVKKFQKGFLINLDNCCSCASHRKIILREILPRQYDLLISPWERNEKGVSCSILVKHLLIIYFWLIWNQIFIVELKETKYKEKMPSTLKRYA